MFATLTRLFVSTMAFIDPPASLPTLYVYHTIGCHLCDQAQQQLNLLQQHHAFDVQYIDIAELDEVKMTHYATRIPVISNGVIEKNWPFSLLDILPLLSHQPIPTQPLL